MTHDVALYGRLLLLVGGTFLYGFLARELLRYPDVARGNVALRVLALGLTAGYAGGLLDRVAAVFLRDGPWRAPLDAGLDLVRTAGWLATFPLLAHAVFRLLPEKRPSPLWLLPGYLTLALFAPALGRFLVVPAPAYEQVARDVFGLYVLHASLSLATTAGFVVHGLRRVQDPGLLGFMRHLLALTGAMLLANGLGAAFPDRLAGLVWLAASQVLWLVLGVTFLVFVQRYNLLRLSLSYRSLRHFLVVIALLGFVTLIGQVAGLDAVVAVGLLLALGYGLAGTRLLESAARRSPLVKRLLSRAITPVEIHELSRRLQEPELSEAEMLALTARSVSEWLATPARFLAPGEAPELAVPPRAFTRVDAPSPAAADALVALRLHAVFPLRVGGEPAGVLALPVSGGGGYDRAELEGVEVALEQLAAALHGRRLLAARLAAERLASERERLSMLGLVAASLAHELKNPLSSMKALSQALAEELAGTPQAEDVAVILEQIERLNASAGEVLGFAKPREAVDLPRLVRSALHVLAPEARRTGVTLDGAGVEEVAAPGSAGAWQTITFNLLLNAVRHAPAGSCVAVRLAARDGQVTLEAENGGEAIPEDLAARLFSPFVTGSMGGPSEPPRPPEGGTGLGLSLVAQRARELGGSVELENTPGRVVFRVRVDRLV